MPVLCQRSISRKLGQSSSRERDHVGHQPVGGLRSRSLLRRGKWKAFKGKVGMTSSVKRAVITLEEGHTIDVTTGL